MSDVVPSAEVQEVIMGSDDLPQQDKAPQEPIQVESFVVVSAQGAGYHSSIGWRPTDVEGNEEEHGDADSKEDL